MITITLQGQPHTLSDPIKTISDLIHYLQIPPSTVLIEHNQVALHRHQWPTTSIQDNDTIEIIRIVAGG